MPPKVLVAPVGSLEAHCSVVALAEAGVCVTAVPTSDVAAVVLFVVPGSPPAPARDLFGDARERPMLLVAPHVDSAALDEARRVGAADLVCWDTAPAVLAEAIDRLVRGESTLPVADSPTADPLRALTERELQIVSLLEAGASNAKIARMLGISYHTARTHVAHVLSKLEVSHRYAAVALAHGSERLVPLATGTTQGGASR